jgi:hypothetical protein
MYQTDTNAAYYRCSWWALRSPGFISSYSLRAVFPTGNAWHFCYTAWPNAGVRPALRLLKK